MHLPNALVFLKFKKTVFVCYFKTNFKKQVLKNIAKWTLRICLRVVFENNFSNLEPYLAIVFAKRQLLITYNKIKSIFENYGQLLS